MFSCYKDHKLGDQVPPIITLIGERKLEHPLGQPYIDPGATAFDEKDGDLTDSIITVSNVDPNQLGEYTVTYNVFDLDSNSAVEVIRDVEVVFSAFSLEGDWSVVHDCAVTSGVADNQTISVESASEFILEGFISIFGAVNFDLEAAIAGSPVTIPSQDVTQFITVSGSGTLGNDGNSMTINVTIENSTPIIGGTDNCTLNYSR
jgi:hypothetical protein